MNDKDIDLYFELTYSAYLVLEPARLVRMDDSDSARLLVMLDDLRRAFPDVTWPFRYVALAAVGTSPDSLTEAQMKKFEVSFDDTDETGFADAPYFYRGDSYEGHELLFFPTEDEQTARAALRPVVNRTLLQSMPRDWQIELVALLDKHDAIEADTPQEYAVRAYNERELECDDPIPHYDRTRKRLVPSLAWRS